MQRGGNGRDDFFGMGNHFGAFGSSRSGSLFPSVFDGRNPFDDPFFTQPFGGMMGPGMFGSSMMGPGMFGSSMMGPGMFGSSMMGPGMFGSSLLGPGTFGTERRFFEEPSNAGFLEQHAPPTTSRGIVIEEIPSDDSRGIVIEEISSDDEEEGGDMRDTEKKVNPRKHLRSGKEPYQGSRALEVVTNAEKKSKHIQDVNNLSMTNRTSPQTNAYSFHSSTVTYGGANGAYYTSSTTRKTGGNGVTLEESKEADTTTGRATHRISRGIHEKGHSVTRKLDDGKVETMQMLHNLNEDELPGFEESWKGSAREHLPDWNRSMGIHPTGINRNNTSNRPTEGWALPSTEQHSGHGTDKRKMQHPHRQ